MGRAGVRTRAHAAAGRSGAEGELVMTGAVKINDWLLSVTCTTNRLYIFFFDRPFPLGISGLVGWEAKVALSPLSRAFALFG